ncbi:Predicted DNA-binding transcriptional regulator YafY, contains an HTH and WYL domains [Pedobacter westerhofensis]|uniref:Predicted DNA-binding transcriptional regulator YafY, contains an HTH and WYL domains n=1 Tax=Pedobacter westerhofensis TaxID=425512 RepID=A0A521FUN3_9SPHI|nr:YafY family protein [Pedobacter westerhofensis]SMO99832.1 Predicted DNA-binding transcriptional regulator YafY, contains an HTH and WYL domains [Pedobacter westerhofensis]
MEITKRFDRILRIFFILQSRVVITIEELETLFSISRRTIYRDLKALEGAGVPIAYEATRGYSIIDGYRIQPSRFTQEEVLSLMIAEKIMQQHETQFIKQHFEAALMKVKASFQLHQKDDLLNWQDKLEVSGGLNADEYLPDVINLLLESIVKKKIPNLSYVKSGDLSAVTRQIEPVGLFYESSFWYLVAFCHLRQDYRNFRLDRVKKVFITEQDFTREHLPVDKLRNDSMPSSITKITVRADQKFAHYLFWERQNYGYKTEVITELGSTMYFEYGGHPTAFARWFMKFADVAKIIEPVFLKDELRGYLLAGLRD